MQAGKVDANPTKAFFVRMITRDISLEDCILDLIDNSVDGAWKLEGGRTMSLTDDTDLSQYRIELNATQDRFSIRDNCGGINFDEAVEYAFTFGRKDTDAPDSYSIGVYGIGMKRAVFKIGEEITVRSTYEKQNGETESFKVPINVPKWLREDKRDWDFDIEPSDDLPTFGVEIAVTRLHEGIAASFGSPLFLQDLKRTIARDYALHMRRGLTILLNNERINGWKIELLQGSGLEPMRDSYRDETDGASVSVEILAGMAAPPPESSDPDDATDGDNRYGWYIVCNGRIVLAADKSEVSGWGTEGWPQWHPQYSGFMGIIVFSSQSAALLPLTTTKRSVDVSSAVYRRARPRMREVSKQWISYTNARKLAVEEAKQIENLARPKSIFDVAQRAQVSLPIVSSKPKVKTANIAYSMPLQRVRDLAEGLGNINMSYRDVGINSFERAYSDLVGEE